MPKTKKTKKQIKLSTKTIAVGAVAITAVLLVSIQIWFNLYVWNVLKIQSTTQLRTQIISAIDGLFELRKSPTDGQKIPEARLILPKGKGDLATVKYTYNEPMDVIPATIDISSYAILNTSKSVVDGTSIDELFESTPIAQACARGFQISFEYPNIDSGDTSLKFIAKKKLADNRDIYITREQNCGDKSKESGSTEHILHQMMDELEKYLLQIQSY